MDTTERKISRDKRMKYSAGVLLTFLCFVSFYSCTTDMKTDEEKQNVLAAHEQRRSATLNGDANTVASMMTDDLTFTHANAVLESKEQFVEALETQRLQYRALTDEDVQVRVNGSTGVVSGTVHIVVEAAGTEYDLRVLFTELWVKEGNSWKMMLWHATEVQ
ncbi:nuclear transport factor 2 family protein [Belliella sp. R4-6]|uniref:Nuclear transport factor 2 family protein n=1 Tax=Belliella alkalica TaxID=1730871 RepID=A0ABS9VGY6_9BACT|nr:nuclear transport factor 2 family protein [Belliella alkalica]MCH7415419.1 nuclear transport factor 2 family protein [Belliella alkalica]